MEQGFAPVLRCGLCAHVTPCVATVALKDQWVSKDAVVCLGCEKGLRCFRINVNGSALLQVLCQTPETAGASVCFTSLFKGSSFLFVAFVGPTSLLEVFSSA